MALVEVPARSVSRQRPWLPKVARLMQLVLIAVVAWGLSFDTASAQATSRGERAPADALCLWLHSDGAGYSRIVLETADQKHVREWRTAEAVDERTRLEVRVAVDQLAPRSRAVLLKARGDVKFEQLRASWLRSDPRNHPATGPTSSKWPSSLPASSVRAGDHAPGRGPGPGLSVTRAPWSSTGNPPASCAPGPGSAGGHQSERSSTGPADLLVGAGSVMLSRAASRSSTVVTEIVPGPTRATPETRNPRPQRAIGGLKWLRGQDLNLGPSGYEPDELPGCSTPRQVGSRMRALCTGKGPGGQALACRSATGTSAAAATSTMVAPVGVSAPQEIR